jgi:translation initiation factor 3 subunit A
LISIGKKDLALTTLKSILLTRRYRQWTTTHEKVSLRRRRRRRRRSHRRILLRDTTSPFAHFSFPLPFSVSPNHKQQQIIMLYAELAVDQKKGAKDAFLQYRRICDVAQTSSLQKALVYYLELAEKRAAVVVKDSDASALAKLDDFDAEDLAPESVAMRLVGGDAAVDREKKSEVAPWLRHLWQAYRTVLDVLRNNAKLHELYQQTARQYVVHCNCSHVTSFRVLFCVVLVKVRAVPADGATVRPSLHKSCNHSFCNVTHTVHY